MNKIELENRLKFLSEQIVNKKIIVERQLRELQSLIDQYVEIKKTLEELNGK